MKYIVWSMLKCACCKKHVYGKKKRRSEYFNDFMTKNVITVWFVHVFGQENITDND